MFRRNTKEAFLTELEAWINEVVAIRADGHNEEIPALVKDGFRKSVLASANYHRELAGTLDKTDAVLAKYHLLMSKIYESFVC